MFKSARYTFFPNLSKLTPNKQTAYLYSFKYVAHPTIHIGIRSINPSKVILPIKIPSQLSFHVQNGSLIENI